MHDEDAAARVGSGRRAATRALVVLGVLAACGAVVEDAGASWSALYLRGELAAGAAAAGLGFVALQGAMTIGRLTGDRVVDRFGQRLVVQVGGVLIALGMGLALALPSVATTLVGFALAGLGVATLVPAVYHAADELPGLPPGLGLAVVNWLLRVGFLLSPPLIGVVADAVSLRVALLMVVIAGLGALLLGRAAQGDRAPGTYRLIATVAASSRQASSSAFPGAPTRLSGAATCFQRSAAVIRSMLLSAPAVSSLPCT